jgi:hypothetical protein
MSAISKSQKDKLFHEVRIMCGAAGRGVEITDEELDVLLKVSVEEYCGKINEWVVEQNFSTLQNKSINQSDLVYSLTTKTLDFERAFAASYSRQTGISTTGTWELKKDYVVITGGTQYYTIPKGREVIDVLWSTPPTIGSSPIYDSLSVDGLAATASGFNFMGSPMNAVLPSYYALLYQQTLKTQKQIWQSDLTYKITAGPNGTRVLHLYPVPGSHDEISGRNGRHLDGTVVFYWYYDTSEMDDVDACIDANKDVIVSPFDVLIDTPEYSRLNESAKARIRRLLLCEAKNVMALGRGKYSGVVKGRDGKEITMDYKMLIEQYTNEKDKIYEDLKVYLERLSYVNQMKIRGDIAEELQRVIKLMPVSGFLIRG